MIHVDRSSVPRPGVLDSAAAIAERDRAEAWFANPSRARQQRFDFRIYHDPAIGKALSELFHGKCAYCEAQLGPVSPLDVELFRPKASVAEAPMHPGYWWLASDWDNMLTSCINCNRVRVHAGERAGKGSRFPLVEEKRRARKPGEEDREEPLLLDPCRDDPEPYFVFDQSGHVVSRDLRGQTCISVFSLNREALVAARRSDAAMVMATISSIDLLLQSTRPIGGPSVAAASSVGPFDADLTSDETLEILVSQLREFTEDRQQFAAMKRQLVRPTLDRLRKLGILEAAPEAVSSTPTITKAERRAAKSAFSDFETSQSSFSLRSDEGRRTYRSERRLIERIEIHNMKAIRDLDLTLQTTGTGRTPWLMLLGENGSGKSTVLQAIALALIGAAALKRLGDMGAVHPRDFIRYRCQSATVSVKLTGFVRPHMLTFEPDRVSFTAPTGARAGVIFGASSCRITGRGWDPQMILLGYGATRLLPRSSSPKVTSTGDTYSRVDNLFDPFVPLRDADDWMASTQKRNKLEFDSATIVLKDLLSLAASARFIIEKGQVKVIDHGAKVSLRQLSDGYQSVVATAIDILDVMTTVWPNLADAEGIVVLDEIGAHLHPTWKMRIVGAIRRAAPAIQFITSTHDPLCLRGLGEGEVVVMRRDEEHRVVTITDLPSPADFRIDQLLTSDFFGLNSTSDPETEREFTRYYVLLAMADRSPEQQTELDDLTARLRDRRYLGATPREHLMYEVVDQLVASHKRSPLGPITNLRQDAIDAVAQAWADDDAVPMEPA